jgi:hypothetical protein
LKKKQIVFGRKDLSNNEHVCGEKKKKEQQQQQYKWLWIQISTTQNSHARCGF